MNDEELKLDLGPVEPQATDDTPLDLGLTDQDRQWWAKLKAANNCD